MAPTKSKSKTKKTQKAEATKIHRGLVKIKVQRRNSATLFDAEVEAEILPGDLLCVHKQYKNEQLDPDERGWIVTHIPTGFCLCLPGHKAWKQKWAVLEFANRLNGPEWRFKSTKWIPTAAREKFLRLAQVPETSSREIYIRHLMQQADKRRTAK